MLAEPELKPPRRRPPYGIYAYTGREWDPEINLYYYRARYYDPKIGRFISEDPIGLRGGLNFYRYVGGNPTRYTDPTGLVTGTGCGPISTQYFAVPRSRVQDESGNPRALAATLGSVKPTCHCERDGCRWRPKINVDATIVVYYSDDTKIPPDVLRRDEAEHVAAILDILNETCSAAARMEALTFRSKIICEASCQLFETSVWLALFFEEPRTHFQSDTGHSY